MVCQLWLLTHNTGIFFLCHFCTVSHTCCVVLGCASDLTECFSDCFPCRIHALATALTACNRPLGQQLVAGRPKQRHQGPTIYYMVYV